MSKTQEFEQFVEKNATKRHMFDTESVALALAGEVGELLGAIKTQMDANARTSYEVQAELGDVLHYLARLAWCYDVSLEELMELNMEKLKKRGAK